MNENEQHVEKKKEEKTYTQKQMNEAMWKKDLWTGTSALISMIGVYLLLTAPEQYYKQVFGEFVSKHVQDEKIKDVLNQAEETPFRFPIQNNKGNITGTYLVFHNGDRFAVYKDKVSKSGYKCEVEESFFRDILDQRREKREELDRMSRFPSRDLTPEQAARQKALEMKNLK